MKKVFFLSCAVAASQMLFAQGNIAAGPAPDIAAHSITFEKTSEEIIAINYVKVNIKATGVLKNVGNKTYFPIEGESKTFFTFEGGYGAGVGSSLVPMAPGESKSYTIFYWYYKKDPKPTVSLQFMHKPKEFEAGKYQPNDVLKKTSI